MSQKIASQTEKYRKYTINIRIYSTWIPFRDRRVSVAVKKRYSPSCIHTQYFKGYCKEGALEAEIERLCTKARSWIDMKVNERESTHTKVMDGKDSVFDTE